MIKRYLVLLLALTAVICLSGLAWADTSSASYIVSSDAVAISDGGAQSSAGYGLLGVTKVYELGEAASSAYKFVAGFFASLVSSSSSSVNPPSAEAFGGVTTTVVKANWSANGNPSGTEYLCQNVTNSTASGWITTLTWTSASLEASTSYNFRVRARNTAHAESSWTALGTQATTGQVTADALVAGVSLKNGDTISGTLTITVSSLLAAASGGIKSVQVDFVDVGYDIVSTTATTITLTLRAALAAGTHTIKIIIFDAAGTEYVLARTGLVVASGAVTTAGPTLAYPNPYDSRAGNLKITYYLSVDAGVNLYVVDTAGRLVWKSHYLSGVNGGKAGYNEISWDTVGMFGQLASDAYIISVMEQGTGKLITKTKLLIWQGGPR